MLLPFAILLPNLPMKKEKIAKIQKQAKENQIQRDKIRNLQKRVTIIGTIGLIGLILMVLTGLFVDENQKTESKFSLTTNFTAQQIIETYIKTPPTISGEIGEKIEITKNGAWIESGEQKYLTLLAARFSTKEMVYTIQKSNIDVIGTWEINLTEKDGGFDVLIKENSQTDNLGYRALLFWDGENRYSENLFESLKEAINQN